MEIRKAAAEAERKLKQIAEKKEMSDSLIRGMSTALNLQYSPNVHFQKVNRRNKRRVGVFQVYTIPISQQFLLCQKAKSGYRDRGDR
jgi:hypothetical protein